MLLHSPGHTLFPSACTVPVEKAPAGASNSNSNSNGAFCLLGRAGSLPV